MISLALAMKFAFWTNIIMGYLQPVGGVTGDDGGAEYDDESDADVMLH